jgi:putative transposase
LVEREDRELPLIVQADLLSLSRASLYYQAVVPSPQEVRIKHRIDEIYTRYPFYGSHRICVQLQREGLPINRKAVQRHMREMGIEAIAPGPNLSRRNLEHRIYPYLLRGLQIERPNQVWGIDITYIRLAAGWLYLVGVIDWHSRYLLSWELDASLEMPFVIRAVEAALGQATPEIWNSDQGSHFTSEVYLDRLRQAEVQISMDGKGRALDNIITERLWRTIKYEEVYLHDYAGPKEAGARLTNYLSFYNHERPHQSLDYRTPAELYFAKPVEKELLATTIKKGETRTLNDASFLS